MFAIQPIVEEEIKCFTFDKKEAVAITPYKYLSY